MIKKMVKKSFLFFRDFIKAQKNPQLTRIKFEGFMNSSDEWFDNFYLKTLISDHKTKTIISSYKPHIIFNSVFSPRPKKSEFSKRIFWTGEDVQNNYTDFKDNLTDICEASFGFDYLEKDNYLRLPLWILYYFNDTFTKDSIKQRVDELNSKPHNPKNFAALIARHDRNGIRQKIIDLAQNGTGLKVNCAGSFLHNDDSLVEQYNDDKIKYLNSFMFNICPENTDTPGYVTEKLFQSFDAGCIPLYWCGGGNPEPGVVNPKAVINLALLSEEDFSAQVKELWTNKNYYEKFIQNKPLLESSVDFIYDTVKKAEKLVRSCHV